MPLVPLGPVIVPPANPVPVVAGMFEISTGNFADHVLGGMDFNGDDMPSNLSFDVTGGFIAGGATDIDVELYNLTDAVQIGVVNLTSLTLETKSIGPVTFVSGSKVYVIRARRNGGAGTGKVSWVAINF